MAPPTRYQRGYSFSGYQATNPAKPLPGPALDNELENIEQAVGETITSLGLIQRADGALRNGIVTNDALAPDLQTGIAPAVPWATGIQYVVGDVVFFDTAFYRCVEAHVSVDFATDLAAGKWTVSADLTPIVADAVAAREDAEAAAAAAGVSAAAAGVSAATAVAAAEAADADATATAADRVQTGIDRATIEALLDDAEQLGTPADGTVTVPKLASSIYASEAEAVAGAENTKLMTALRTDQLVADRLTDYATEESVTDDIADNTRHSYTRASTALYVNDAGLLVSAAVDEIRTKRNPLTLETEGLLIEPMRENFCLYSSTFDNAWWLKTGTTVSPNVDVGQDGTTTADKLVEAAAAGTHVMTTTTFATLDKTVKHTFSVFLKAAGRDRGNLSLNAFSGNQLQVIYDLTAGTVGTATASGNASEPAAGIEPWGDGWFRVWVTGKPSSVAGLGFQAGITMRNAALATSYTGDGTSGVFVWGAQVEIGDAPTSLIPTTTVSALRAADQTLKAAYVNLLRPINPVADFGVETGTGKAAIIYNRNTARLQAAWAAAVAQGVPCKMPRGVTFEVGGGNRLPQYCEFDANGSTMRAGALMNSTMLLIEGASRYNRHTGVKIYDLILDCNAQGQTTAIYPFAWWNVTDLTVDRLDINDFWATAMNGNDLDAEGTYSGNPWLNPGNGLYYNVPAAPAGEQTSNNVRMRNVRTRRSQDNLDFANGTGVWSGNAHPTMWVGDQFVVGKVAGLRLEHIDLQQSGQNGAALQFIQDGLVSDFRGQLLGRHIYLETCHDMDIVRPHMQDHIMIDNLAGSTADTYGIWVSTGDQSYPGVPYGGSDNIRIRDAYIHNMSRTYSTPTGTFKPICISGNDAAAAKDISVTGCTIRDIATDGSSNVSPRAISIEGKVTKFDLSGNSIQNISGGLNGVIGFNVAAPYGASSSFMTSGLIAGNNVDGVANPIYGAGAAVSNFAVIGNSWGSGRAAAAYPTGTIGTASNF